MFLYYIRTYFLPNCGRSLGHFWKITVKIMFFLNISAISYILSGSYISVRPLFLSFGVRAC